MSSRQHRQSSRQPVDLVAARQRLRPTAAASSARPPTAQPPAGHDALYEAGGRLRALTPPPVTWSTSGQLPAPPRTALIWHPQENFIGPALATPVVYSRPRPQTQASAVPVTKDDWTRRLSPLRSDSRSPSPHIPARNFNDIPILHPSRLNVNNTYFSSDFSSSASSSRPKTSRASSPYSITSARHPPDNRPKTRGGGVRGYSPVGRAEEQFSAYPGYRDVLSASRHLSPSRTGDYGPLLRPISRGPSPSRGVTVLYERPLMSRVASPEYGELSNRGLSPARSDYSSAQTVRPKSRGVSPNATQVRGRPTTRGGKPHVTSHSPSGTSYSRGLSAATNMSRGPSPTPSYARDISPASSTYSRPKSRGISPSSAYGKSRVASPSPTRVAGLKAPPRGRPKTKGGKNAAAAKPATAVPDEILPEPPRTPATMPIMMPAPEIAHAARVAPAVLRSRSRQRGSASFVVWHDAPYLPPPRTPLHEPEVKKGKKGAAAGKKATGTNGGATAGGAQTGTAATTAENGTTEGQVPPHIMEKGDWGRHSPVPGALGDKKTAEEEMEAVDDEVHFDVVSAMIHLGAADLIKDEITGNWSSRRTSRFNSAASSVSMAGRMSGTARRRFASAAEEQAAAENLQQASQEHAANMQGMIEEHPESEYQSSVVKPMPAASSDPPTADPPASSTSSKPEVGNSALAAAMMSGSTGTISSNTGSNQTAALTMVSSTTVTGTSVTGIPTTISMPTDTTNSPPSSATSTATVRAGGVAAHSAAPAASAVSAVLSRPGSVTAASPAPMATASETESASSSALPSTTTSASSTGRFSAGFSSASARVRRLASGSSSFKGSKPVGVKEEDLEEEEEEKEPPISEEANKIKELLLTEGLDSDDVSDRLRDIMLVHEMSSSVAASKVIEALESQGIPGGMLLKRMAAVPAGSGLNTGEAAKVLGNMLSIHSAKAIAAASEKAQDKIGRQPVRTISRGKSMTKIIADPSKTVTSAGSTVPSTSAMSATSEAVTSTTTVPSSAGTKEEKTPVPASAGSKRGFLQQFNVVNTAIVQVTRFTSRRQSIQATPAAMKIIAAKDAVPPIPTDPAPTTSPVEDVSTVSSTMQTIADTTKAGSDVIKSATDTASSTMQSTMDSAKSGMEKTLDAGMDAAKTSMEAAKVTAKDTSKTVSEMGKSGMESAQSAMGTAKSMASEAVASTSGMTKDMGSKAAAAGKGMMTAGLGKAPPGPSAKASGSGVVAGSSGTGGGGKKPTSDMPSAKTSKPAAKDVKAMEKAVVPETPTCCGSRAGWARRLAAKNWPACCVRCCIRVPSPAAQESTGCCARLRDKLACCVCCRRPRDIETGRAPAATLLPPHKPSLASRLCRALGCSSLSACCAALSCARCCRCCVPCCTRCSPCCRKCCRGGAVADVTPNPLEDPGRRKSHPGLKSKRQSRSLPGSSGEVRKLDPSLLDQNSVIQGAIPVLPLPLAWFCLVCNVLVPGLGTIASGAFCLCVGMPRFTVEDRPENRLSTFILDLVVGVGQFFTVIFCLVGWGWSIWWGTIMVRLAKKQKRLLIKAAEDLAKPKEVPKKPPEKEKSSKQ